MIKLVTFDVDDTLTIGTTIWEQFYIEIGTWEKIGKKYLDLFLEKKITFDEFIKLDVGAFAGNHERIIFQAIEKLEFVSGIDETIKGLKKRGILSAIVSGTIGQFAKHLQKEHGFDFCFANHLKTDGKNILTGEIDLLVPAYKKNLIMRKLKKDLSLKTHEVMAVGDSPLDFCMFEEAGISVCVEHAKPEVKARVQHVLPDKDLRPLLEMI